MAELTDEQKYDFHTRACERGRREKEFRKTYQLPTWLKKDLVKVINRKKAACETNLNKSERLFSLSKWEDRINEIEYLERILNL